MTNDKKIPKLEEVLAKTIQAIEQGKVEIFEIAELSRQESERLKVKLMGFQDRIRVLIDNLEKFEEAEKKARYQLMLVSRDIRTYTEEDIRLAYERASDLQADIRILRAQEKQLGEERREVERQYLHNRETVARAENLISKVGVALDYLEGDMQEVNSRLGEMEARGSLGARIIKAQEEERRRVAREIHDGPAQSLANMVLRAEFCERLIDKDIWLAKRELGQLKGLLRDNLKDVRKIIYDLRPMALDDLGLMPAISHYVENFRERNPIDVDLIIPETDIRLPPAVEVSTYRVLQEALQNIQKHSFARRVLLQLDIEQDQLRVMIKDDGKGFNVMEVLADKEREGYGLLSMRERIELLKGRVDFNSQPGKGTEIVIVIPLDGAGGEENVH